MELKAYIVEFTIGRQDLEIEIEKKLDKLEEYLFFTERVLPKSQRDLLEDFDNRVINDYRESSVCVIGDRYDWEKYDRSYKDLSAGRDLPCVFMLPKQYDEFVNRIETQYKQEYDQLKSEILSKYEETILSFKQLLKASNPVSPINLDELFPSKKEYEESYCLDYAGIESDFQHNEKLVEKLKEYSAK